MRRALPARTRPRASAAQPRVRRGRARSRARVRRRTRRPDLRPGARKPVPLRAVDAVARFVRAGPRICCVRGRSCAALRRGEDQHLIPPAFVRAIRPRPEVRIRFLRAEYALSGITARCLLLVVPAILACCPAAAQAQASEWLLPRIRHYSHPQADPLSPRFGLGLLRTDLLRTRGPERLPFMLSDSADAARDMQV